MSCIFCQIVEGDIPSMKVFENDNALAFMDINPLAFGHVLVIPKKHYARLDQMTPEEVAELTKLLPELAAAVVKATDAQGYNILQNNGACAQQSVDHVHFHIIPRTEGDGLGYRWNAKEYPEGKDRDIQRKIVTSMG